jgi:hypothetical protein
MHMDMMHVYMYMCAYAYVYDVCVHMHMMYVYVSMYMMYMYAHVYTYGWTREYTLAHRESDIKCPPQAHVPEHLVSTCSFLWKIVGSLWGETQLEEVNF